MTLFRSLKKQFISLERSDRLHCMPLPIVALTGGLASGKSTVTEILKEQDFRVICADALVKKIYKKKESELFVSKHFPTAFSKGRIDSGELRALAFTDKLVREKLESFIYSFLPDEFQKEAESITGQDFIFYDVPLLFEKGLGKKVDLSVCIYCREDQQRVRASRRDHMDDGLVEKILSAQMPLDQKKELAHIVLYNASTIEELRREVANLLKRIVDSKETSSQSKVDIGKRNLKEILNEKKRH